MKKNKKKKNKSNKGILLNLAVYAVGIHSLVLFISSSPGTCAAGACKFLSTTGITLILIGIVQTFYLVNSNGSKTFCRRLSRAVILTLLTIGALYWYLYFLVQLF